MVPMPAQMAQTQMMAPGLVVTNDPSLKCYFEECNYIGNASCRWSNNCCRCAEDGGCRRRFCPQHAFVLNLTGMPTMGTREMCVKCGPEFYKHNFKNAKCSSFATLGVMLTLVLLPSIIVFSLLA